MKLIIIGLILMLFSLPAGASDIPDHAITITPGQPWSMVVQFKFAVTAPITKPSNYYLAYIGSGSPLSGGMIARMHVEASTVDATAVMLSLTDVQTAALADKGLTWWLVYLPDLGQSTLIAKGNVEVKS